MTRVEIAALIAVLAASSLVAAAFPKLRGYKDLPPREYAIAAAILLTVAGLLYFWPFL